MSTHCVSLINKLPRILLNILLLVFVLFSLALYTEAQETPKRPTVGLVLSGGGAHGMAHLGVIKVMEEAGLRPACITGVSMGNIIGVGYMSIIGPLRLGIMYGNRSREDYFNKIKRYISIGYKF